MGPADDAAPQPRIILGRYRIEKTLGRGGMGEVLLAHDELLNRPVALKRLDPQGDDRDARRRGILREARRASAISDRRIASIYDVVDLDDEVVLVMEYVDGVTLRRRMADPVPIEEFWNLATQCVEGVAAAHAHGVIHRDIKPENFMVTPAGQVKVLDFGIAKRADVDGETTTTTGSDSRSGRVAGTPHYMAPEAHLGGAVDERTDIFSLGVVFYELLTSRRPFEGGNYAVVVNQVLNTPPPPVATLNPAVGWELSRVVDGMLAKNQADRIPSAAELLRRMKSARPRSNASRAKPRSRRACVRRTPSSCSTSAPAPTARSTTPWSCSTG